MLMGHGHLVIGISCQLRFMYILSIISSGAHYLPPAIKMAISTYFHLSFFNGIHKQEQKSVVFFTKKNH